MVEIGWDSVAALASAMGSEGDRVAPRLARGCRAFAIKDSGEVAAYGWLSASPEWIGELHLEISPAPGEAYVWNCVTLAAHRRRGLYRALLDGIVSRARADRLVRLWIGSVEDPAEKADVDVGFSPVLLFSARRLGPLRWLRAVPAPGAPPDLAAEARRRLGLRTSFTVGTARARVH